jgi:hypothetical protein
MRTPEHVSPSSLALFEKDLDEFVLKHIVENRPPRLGQTLYMAVGSSFDAWVKSALHAAVFGPGADPKYEFSAIFESQVEEPNRDAARESGLRVFDNYVHTGAYDELLALLLKAKTPPQFEFSVKGVVGGVPLLGKPDCEFMSEYNVDVTLDWKVKGYYSKHSASPSKNYQLCRDGLDWPKPSRSNETAHKNYKALDFHGLTINEGYMEDANKDYADQLSIYGWLMGRPVGAEKAIVCIDEIVSKSRQDQELPPLLRVAQHRSRVKPEYQEALLARLQRMWNAVSTGWLYQDLTREESDLKLEHMERVAIGLASDGSDEEDWYNRISRQGYFR